MDIDDKSMEGTNDKSMKGINVNNKININLENNTKEFLKEHINFMMDGFKVQNSRTVLRK